MCPYWLSSALMLALGTFIARKTWKKGYRLYEEESRTEALLQNSDNKDVCDGVGTDSRNRKHVGAQISYSK